MGLFYLPHYIHMEWHQHGLIRIEGFLEIALALPCCLGVIPEEIGLLVDLVGRKDMLLLMMA